MTRWIPGLHADDVGVKAACPKCDKLSVVALPDGGIECKRCGYRKPSPYSGPPSLWARNTSEASGYKGNWLSDTFLSALAIGFAVAFGVGGLHREDWSFIFPVLSLLAIGLISAVFGAFYFREYRAANRKANLLWSGLDELDRRAARYIQAEMEHDLGF